MRTIPSLRLLSDIAEDQWGLVTSAQAREQGISGMTLTRMAQDELLVRVAHGVYRIGGAPAPEHEQLRAAWLAVAPDVPAWRRLQDRPQDAVISGISAAAVFEIGDLRADTMELSVRRRKQTQRVDLRYRRRELPPEDVTLHGGLPLTTRERTIADLVDDGQDLTTVADALRDASRQLPLDMGRLAHLLETQRERPQSGESLFDQLMRLAGLDLEATAAQVAAIPDLSDLLRRRLPTTVPDSGGPRPTREHATPGDLLRPALEQTRQMHTSGGAA